MLYCLQVRKSELDYRKGIIMKLFKSVRWSNGGGSAAGTNIDGYTIKVIRNDLGQYAKYQQAPHMGETSIVNERWSEQDLYDVVVYVVECCKEAGRRPWGGRWLAYETLCSYADVRVINFHQDGDTIEIFVGYPRSKAGNMSI